MDQLRKLFATLSVRQRLAIAAAAVFVAGGIWWFTGLRRESDFHPLYTSMALEDAGAVIQKLKESAVPYRLADNGATVLVPSARVAEARLNLAAAGLPKSGRMGFELFDKTNFGATEFVERINYQRALEGELERSVMALAEVEQARVHLTFPKESIFLDASQPAKASVMVRLRPGTYMQPQNVTAIAHLVASAVEGLAPESVAVLDMRGNLLGRPRKPSQAGESPDENLETERRIERDLVAKMNTTLEPLLGAARFHAAASVECDWTSGEQSEETFDPAKEALLTSQKSEDAGAALNASGVPGTASNLPRPTSRPSVTPTGMTRRTESNTYQPSRFVKRTRLAQGNVRRLSLSVLVDQELRWEGQGRQMRPVLVAPTPEKLKTIRDLIAGATGLNTARGDQLIVESLPFDSTLHAERPTPPAVPVPASPQTSPWKRTPRMMVMVGVGVMAVLFLLGAGLYLARRKRHSKRAGVSAKTAIEPGAAHDGNQVGDPDRSGGSIAGSSGDTAAKLVEQLAERKATGQIDAGGVLLGSAASPTEILRKQVIEAVKKEPTVAAKVVLSWLQE